MNVEVQHPQTRFVTMEIKYLCDVAEKQLTPLIGPSLAPPTVLSPFLYGAFCFTRQFALASG